MQYTFDNMFFVCTANTSDYRIACLCVFKLFFIEPCNVNRNIVSIHKWKRVKNIYMNIFQCVSLSDGWTNSIEIEREIFSNIKVIYHDIFMAII